MKTVGREALFALLAWAIPFAASVCLFGLKSTHPPLFDTLMGVVLSTSTTLLGVASLRRVRKNFIAHGAWIGVFWAAANWLLDGLMFSSGPMRMSLINYTMDIGLAYLAIPAITIGLGAAAAKASGNNREAASGC